MNHRLSNRLPLLKVRGNRVVVADSSEPVLLRGVNRSGLEWAEPDEHGFCSAAAITPSEIEFVVRDWNCNIIRLPFNQDWALNGRARHSANTYLENLDCVIGWASRCGAYTLLDLQWLDADRSFGGDRNFVAPLPNLYSLDVWNLLAARYRNEPAVLYDVFNEPHDCLADDPHPLMREDGSLYPMTHRKVTMAEWQPWALRLVDTIRAVNPEALIFVSGVDWGYDLRGMPLNRCNIVYATHVYRTRTLAWDVAFGALAPKGAGVRHRVGREGRGPRMGSPLSPLLRSAGHGMDGMELVQ